MKEKLIQEISTAMAEVLSFEQVAHLNSVLLQVISQYTITEDGEALHENAVSNDRLLDIFLSAKQVEGCTTPTIKYYGSTIRQLFKKMPKKVTDYTTEDIRAYLAVFQRKNKSSRVTIDNIRRIFSSFFAWLEEEDYIVKSPQNSSHNIPPLRILPDAVNIFLCCPAVSYKYHLLLVQSALSHIPQAVENEHSHSPAGQNTDSIEHIQHRTGNIPLFNGVQYKYGNQNTKGIGLDNI